MVVAVMYWLGWEMGAVEAISLSILVGSSVDYCLHLVEGFLLAGDEENMGTVNHSTVWAPKRQTLTSICKVGSHKPIYNRFVPYSAILWNRFLVKRAYIH